MAERVAERRVGATMAVNLQQRLDFAAVYLRFSTAVISCCCVVVQHREREKRFDDVSVVIRVGKSHFFPYNFLLFCARLSLSDERIWFQSFFFAEATGGGSESWNVKRWDLQPQQHSNVILCAVMTWNWIFPWSFSLCSLFRWAIEEKRENCWDGNEPERNLLSFSLCRRDAMNYWRTAQLKIPQLLSSKNKIVFIIE